MISRKVGNILATVSAVALLGVAAVASAAGGPNNQQSDRRFQSGEMLIQFQTGFDAAAQNRAMDSIGASRQEMILPAANRSDQKGDLVLARLPVGLEVADAIRGIQAQGGIEFAEPNWIYTHNATSNDPLFTDGSLWGMYGDASSPANQYGSQAAEAWGNNHTCGSDVYVGVIDEGLMHFHEDLAANAWSNQFDPEDGIDNDGNGYVDDIHGWDFDGGDNSTFDGTQDDHGTHVSGTIAGAGGNGKGVAGVCWSAKLISAKFLGRRGGTTANAILAVDYITDLKTRHGLNIVATNNSWGGGGFSQGLADAITRAGAADILFIAAAGNDSNDNDASPSYPSSYNNDNIIGVASITSSGAMSSFSSYGATSVDLGAPGSGIYSTLPARSRGNTVSSYGSYSGTSMATPHVTGAAALYASSNPGASAAQIKSAILSNATATSSLQGKVATGGRLKVDSF